MTFIARTIGCRNANLTYQFSLVGIRNWRKIAQLTSVHSPVNRLLQLFFGAVVFSFNNLIQSSMLVTFFAQCVATNMGT